MTRVTFSIGLAMALLLGSVAGAPAWALDDQYRARDGVRNGDIRPFGQIKHDLEQQFGGRVLDVQMQDRGKDQSYNVKLLTKDGDVIMIETDARTGRIIGVKGGR